MHKTSSIGAALAIALAAGALGYGLASMHPYGGWGMMGGYGYGPNMMGGYGPGMMHGPGPFGPRGYGNQGNLNLSTDDVKSYLERWIAGSSRLKVGDVKEKDADTIEADIVTKDNSLVQHFEVNRHTGLYRPSGS